MAHAVRRAPAEDENGTVTRKTDQQDQQDQQRRAPRRRGLLDPADLRGSHLRSQGSVRDLEQVRRWVLSVLFVLTIGHLAAGTALVPVIDDELGPVGRVVLLALAIVVGMGAVVTGLLIHGRRPVSAWVLLGALPGLVGAWLTYR